MSPMISISIFVFVLFFIIKRNQDIGNPVYIYRGDFFEDRYIEILCICSLAFLFLFTLFINRYAGRDLLAILFCIFGIAGLTVWDYRKNKIGIYSNGILFRSMFVFYQDIYTFKSYNLKQGNIKIRLYIRKKANPELLDKMDLVFDEKIGEKWETYLSQYIEQGKPVAEHTQR